MAKWLEHEIQELEKDHGAKLRNPETPAEQDAAVIWEYYTALLNSIRG